MTTPMIPAADLAASLFRQLDEKTVADLRDYIAHAVDARGSLCATRLDSLRLALDAEMKKGDESVDSDRKREVDGRKPS